MQNWRPMVWRVGTSYLVFPDSAPPTADRQPSTHGFVYSEPVAPYALLDRAGLQLFRLLRAGVTLPHAVRQLATDDSSVRRSWRRTVRQLSVSAPMSPADATATASRRVVASKIVRGLDALLRRVSVVLPLTWTYELYRRLLSVSRPARIRARYRQVVENNVALAFAPEPRSAQRRIVRSALRERSHHEAELNLPSRVPSDRLTEVLLERVTFDGADALGPSEPPKGTIYCAYHFSSVRLLNAVLAMFQPISVLRYSRGQDADTAEDDLVASLGLSINQVDVADSGAAVYRLYRVLRSHEAAVMHVDAALPLSGLVERKARAHKVAFLATALAVSPTASALHAASGARVVVTYIERRKGLRFVVHAKPLPRAATEGSRARLTEAVFAELEAVVRQQPESWLQLRDLQLMLVPDEQIEPAPHGIASVE